MAARLRSVALRAVDLAKMCRAEEWMQVIMEQGGAALFAFQCSTLPGQRRHR